MPDSLSPSGTLLVVDDTPANVDVLAGILREHYQIKVALDGERALQLAAAQPPDLILLDVMMPGMDGYEVCRRLKADPRTAAVPVIFVTAKTEVEDEMQGLELGAVDYLTKPVSAPIVLARVRAHLALKHSSDRLRDLSNQLSRYLSPQVYRSIFEGRTRVEIQAQRKKLTVFFSDICGFTALTESMEAEDLSEVLNEYLDAMAQITLRYGGTLDKFIGDAILAFFGDPETRGTREDAVACVEMALAMRAAVASLNETWKRRGLSFPLQVRMGISSGFCTVGNFGSAERMDYTILGSQVNLASRLENAAQPGQILLAEETWELVRRAFSARAVEPLPVKGFHQPIQAWQLLGPARPGENTADLRADLPGLRLELQPDQVPPAQRAEAIRLLQEGVARLV